MASGGLLPILVSALVSLALGWLWYRPEIFGRRHLRQERLLDWGVLLVALLIMASVLSYFMTFTSAGSFVDGLSLGFMAWLGLSAPAALFMLLRHRTRLSRFLVDGSYLLVVLLLMGAILAVW